MALMLVLYQNKTYISGLHKVIPVTCDLSLGGVLHESGHLGDPNYYWVKPMLQNRLASIVGFSHLLYIYSQSSITKPNFITTQSIFIFYTQWILYPEKILFIHRVIFQG